MPLIQPERRRTGSPALAMSGYVSLPAAWRGDADLAASWVNKARDHVGTMPPKVKKPKKR
jgi:hypothetical protein